MSAPASFARRGERAHVAHDAGRGLRLRDAAPRSRRPARRAGPRGRRRTASRPTRSAMCSTSQPYARAISAQRSPKYPAETATTRSPGEVRFATTDSSARRPRGRVEEDLALRPVDLLQAVEHLPVRRPEVGAAVMDDRKRHRGQHLEAEPASAPASSGSASRPSHVSLAQASGPSALTSRPGSLRGSALAFGAALLSLRLASRSRDDGATTRRPELAAWSAALLAYAAASAALDLGSRVRLGRALRSASTTCSAPCSQRLSSVSDRSFFMVGNA